MAAGTFVPVEVYLRTSDYEPDAEYVDGEILERPKGDCVAAKASYRAATRSLRSRAPIMLQLFRGFGVSVEGRNGAVETWA